MVFRDCLHTRIYHQLMERAANRVLNGYVERHHKLPKALGGDDNPSNIVMLTAREHLFAHRLLVRITTGQARRKMISALWAMCTLPGGGHGRLKPNSRVYAAARAAYAKVLSERLLGKPKTAQHRQRISAGNRGKTLSPETRMKISASRKGKSGQKRTEKQRETYAESKRGAKNPSAKSCMVNGKVFSTINEAAEFMGLKRGKVTRLPGFLRLS